MSDPLTMLPPWVALFALTAVVAVLPRRPGHAVAVAGALGVLGWVLAAPAGTHLPATVFGFDAVLTELDAFSRVVGSALALVAAAGVAYSYAAGGDRRLTALALCYVGGGLAAVLAGDWLTLVVWWEAMAVTATLLLWHRSETRRVGVRYAIYHEVGGLLLAAGVLLHYASAGTFVYGDGVTGGLAAVLVALGLGVNAAFVGLHVWLVDAYPRTHVATSVVLAAVTTKVGAYAIVRAFPDGNVAFAYLGAAMALFGVTFAVLQTDVRRLLSYHVVSQVGYMVAGFGASVPLARAGAATHLLNNVVYKSLLFMVAGVLIRRAGAETLGDVDAHWRAVPRTAAVFLVAALSIAGLPGFNGFVSKGLVLDGVEAAGLDAVWYALVVAGVGTVVSFAKFGYYAFLHGAPDAETRDLDAVETVTLGGLAVVCVVLGVAPGVLLAPFPADAVAAAKPFAASQFLKAGVVAAVGVVGFSALKPALAARSPARDLDVVYHPLGRRLRAWSVRAAGRVEDGVDGAGRALADGVLALGRTQLGAPALVIRRGILALLVVLAALLALLVP